MAAITGSTLLMAGIGSLVSSGIGAASASGDRAAASQATMDAYNELLKLGLPPEQARPLLLEEIQRQGLYTPELEEAVNLQESKVAQIQEDPNLRQQQVKALELISQRTDEGLTAEDRLAFNQAQLAADQAAKAKEASILQEMAARGQAGGGNELIARLQAGQSSANRLASQGDEVAAASVANKLAALTQLANQSGQLRSQDFNVEQTKADADDRIARFNIEQSIARQRQNVGAKNQAQLANLSEAQRIADTNVNLRNQEQLRRRQAEQQDFQNRQNLTAMKSNARLGQASQLNQQAQGTAQTAAGIGQAIAGAGSAYADWDYKNELLKKQK